MTVSTIRAILLIAIAPLLLSSCSSLLARSSTYADVLSAGTPRAEVVAKLGQPKTVTVVELDHYLVGDSKAPCTRESFLLRGKIPDENLATNYMNLNAMTLGLAEFLLFPIELGRSAASSVVEKEIFVHFCQRGDTSVIVGLPFES